MLYSIIEFMGQICEVEKHIKTLENKYDFPRLNLIGGISANKNSCSSLYHLAIYSPLFSI